MASRPSHPPASALRNLLTHEASGGLILIASAALALLVANSAAAPAYFAALAYKILGLSVLHWVDDALMALSSSWSGSRSSASCSTASSRAGRIAFCPASAHSAV
jgi:hypothetical protein